MKLIKCWGYNNLNYLYKNIAYPITGSTPLETRTNLIKSVIMATAQRPSLLFNHDSPRRGLLDLFIKNEDSAHSYNANDKQPHEADLDELADDFLCAIDTLDGHTRIWKNKDDKSYLCEKGKYRIKAGTIDELEVIP